MNEWKQKSLIGENISSKDFYPAIMANSSSIYKLQILTFFNQISKIKYINNLLPSECLYDVLSASLADSDIVLHLCSFYPFFLGNTK